MRPLRSSSVNFDGGLPFGSKCLVGSGADAAGRRACASSQLQHASASNDSAKVASARRMDVLPSGVGTDRNDSQGMLGSTRPALTRVWVARTTVDRCIRVQAINKLCCMTIELRPLRSLRDSGRAGQLRSRRGRTAPEPADAHPQHPGPGEARSAPSWSHARRPGSRRPMSAACSCSARANCCSSRTTSTATCCDRSTLQSGHVAGRRRPVSGRDDLRGRADPLRRRAPDGQGAACRCAPGTNCWSGCAAAESTSSSRRSAPAARSRPGHRDR